MNNLALQYLCEHEWSGPAGKCPSCGGLGPNFAGLGTKGHWTGCQLAAALEELNVVVTRIGQPSTFTFKERAVAAANRAICDALYGKPAEPVQADTPIIVDNTKLPRGGFF